MRRSRSLHPLLAGILLALLLLVGFSIFGTYSLDAASGAAPVVAPQQAATSTPLAQAVAPVEMLPDRITLENSAWIMASIDGQLPVEGSVVTLQLQEDGTAFGSDGCNRFTTTWSQVDEGSLSFGAVAGTMMACEEPIMEQADAFQQALASVTAYTQTRRQLILFADDEIVLTFVADVQSLDGSTWTVTLFNNGREAVVGPLDGSDISITFEEDRVFGSAGCNNFFGGFETSNQTIAIGPLGATMRFCTEPEGVMEQEMAVIAALESAATYRIEGQDLWLRTADDAIAVLAARAEEVDLPEPEPRTPTGVVAGTNALNIRSGPGTNFPVIGVARMGDEGTIVGRSADGGWWAFDAPQTPGGVGWASAQFVAATYADDVPVIAAPPTPTPLPTRPPATATPRPAVPVPTATPQAQISFWADRTTINAGQCATLFWDVNDVQGVWVYPQGSDFTRFGRAGQGSERVCPDRTTTWEMRVLLRDGTTQFRWITINVIQQIAPPQPPAVAPTPTPTAVPIAPPAPPVVEPDVLAGTRWSVTNFNNGQGAVVGLVEGTTITLDFAINVPGQVTGNSGCNGFTSTYVAAGSSLTMGAPSGTMRLCAEPEGVMEQESQFLAALPSAATFTVSGDSLQIRTAGD
ncbi:MAG: META domain-containing protein, partial [Caldilineaceae bacterium]